MTRPFRMFSGMGRVVSPIPREMRSDALSGFSARYLLRRRPISGKRYPPASFAKLAFLATPVVVSAGREVEVGGREVGGGGRKAEVEVRRRRVRVEENFSGCGGRAGGGGRGGKVTIKGDGEGECEEGRRREREEGRREGRSVSVRSRSVRGRWAGHQANKQINRGEA